MIKFLSANKSIAFNAFNVSCCDVNPSEQSNNFVSIVSVFDSLIIFLRYRYKKSLSPTSK